MSLNARQYNPVFEQPVRLGNFVGGGTVTQQTNRTTAVTLNTISGQITTNTASLAAEATATFTVNNNQVFADDVVIVAISGGSNSGGTVVFVSAIAAGSFAISVQNNNAAAGTAETGAITINFLVMKASQTS